MNNDTTRNYSVDDLTAIREKLANTSGPEYWRSLEEVAQTDTFKGYIHDEFHATADSGQPLGAVSRRNFLQVMGASLALAGVTTGCSRQPDEKIYPYVKQPEEFIPGKPTYFASTHVSGGYGQGVLVESHMGRPTKIEGLPSHPGSLGRTDAQTQATILDLYDPDRAGSVLHNDGISNWSDFIASAKSSVAANPGGVRVLTGAVTSPFEAAKIQAFIAAYSGAQWHRYEPFGRDNDREASKLVFGRYVDTLLNFKDADVVVSLDSDVFDRGAASVRYTADYATRRNVADFDTPYLAPKHHADASEITEETKSAFANVFGNNVAFAAEVKHDTAGDHGAKEIEHTTPQLNRTYAFESSPTLLGAMADHRFPLRPSQIEGVARELADALGVQGAMPGGESSLTPQQIEWVASVVDDLNAHKEHSIITVGQNQPASVHVLAHEINALLGNVDKTVSYIEAVEVDAVHHLDSLKSLVEDMNAGKVSTLLVMGDTNPVYTAPVDLNFAGAMENVSNTIRLSRYVDETATKCKWSVPESHYLEAWGNVCAYDGTQSVIQPLIAPMVEGVRSRVELISALMDSSEKKGYAQLQAYYASEWGVAADSDDFNRKWRSVMAKGVIEGTAANAVSIKPKSGVQTAVTEASNAGGNNLEVLFMADPSVGDGTFSNNAWMQEVPNPLTKLTWDNAVIVGYSTAQALGLKSEDEVTVEIGGNKVKGAVWVQPGHPSDTITLHAGYGRKAMGKVCVASELYLGFDAYSVRKSDFNYSQTAKITKLNSTYPLARTEEHYNMEGRGLVRHFDELTFRNDPNIVAVGEHHEFHNPTEEQTLMNVEEKNVWKKEGTNRHSWAMTIDLNQCTGCNACIVACQSENIIPVVGKDEVRKGREMQWIRLDRYFYSGREKDIPFLSERMPADIANPSLQKLDEQKKRNHALDNPTVYFQPVPCMQCENALCEIVCPVGATMHSREGLNDMVYNRCIGTRYCSNNCPYKVRRFNFFNYTRTPLGSRGDRGWTTLLPDAQGVSMKFDATHVNPESLKPMRNPDVTVRTRGVMEKCTYCVQRINAARIDAKKDGEKIADGTVLTACQQSCPAGAITFGDMQDENSAVSKNRASARNYQILADLNTKPRTTYLAKLTNANPDERLKA